MGICLCHGIGHTQSLGEKYQGQRGLRHRHMHSKSLVRERRMGEPALGGTAVATTHRSLASALHRGHPGRRVTSST